MDGRGTRSQIGSAVPEWADSPLQQPVAAPLRCGRWHRVVAVVRVALIADFVSTPRISLTLRPGG